MRTTITLDSDVEALVRAMMLERGLSFKEAVNTALRSALAKRSQENFRTRTFSMGAPAVPIDQALRLAADLEDAEIQRKLSVGK